MGIWKRLKGLIRGMLNVFVSKAEEKNPVALIEDAKYQINKSKKDAEKQIIALQANAEMMKIEITEAENKKLILRKKMDVARQSKDVDTLASLLLEMQNVEEYIQNNTAAHQSATEEIAKIKQEYKRYAVEANDKLNELKRLSAQMKVSEIQKNISSLKSKFTGEIFSTGNLSDSMDRVKEIINKRTAFSNAVSSIIEEKRSEDDRISVETDMRLENAKMEALRLIETQASEEDTQTDA